MLIAVWGCGERTNYFLTNNLLNKNQIICFIDNATPPHKNATFDRIIHPTEIIDKIDFSQVAYILITVKDFAVCRDILKQIQELKLPEKKFLFVYNYHLDSVTHVYVKVHQQADEDINLISPKLFECEVKRPYQRGTMCNVQYRCYFDLIDSGLIIGKGYLSYENEYLEDYNRYRTFEFCINEIERSRIQGDLAEVQINEYEVQESNIIYV